MKIALISEKYPPDAGGLAVSVERLAQLLSDAGHQAHVVTLTGGMEPGRRASGELRGVPVHRLGTYRRSDDTLAAWFDYIVHLHANFHFDLLHAYYITQTGFVTVYAARYLGLPGIVSARGNDLDRAVFDPGKAAHALYALQNASAVTANSHELARKAQALAPGLRVDCIPNGVDAVQFQPQPRDAALSASLSLENETVIGFSGEARSKKGLAIMLLAFQQVAGQCPACLLLAGGVRSGEDRDLVKIFQKQNPDLRLVVTPFVPLEHMPAYYSLMDVLIMPSQRDGLPNALLEALACQRAVIATPVGGMLDVIVDGENGLFVPPGDFQALADGIIALLGDPERRENLGENGRKTVLEHFTLQQELQANLDIYRRVLE